MVFGIGEGGGGVPQYWMMAIVRSLSKDTLM